LKRLNLGGNELAFVPKVALSSLDMLKKLEIQENRISDITEGDFIGMPKFSTKCNFNPLKPALTFSNSAFCLQNVIMGFV
jgi:Leucine-rich repeat (LRR) protein